QNGRVVYSGCLRGAGDVKFVAMISLLSVMILRPALTYLFCYPLREVYPAMRFAVTGQWLAFVIDAFVRDFLLAARVKKGKWLNVKL
ncbi:MAG: MATE family efflux transporter, partial [Eubacteriales bacterium]|nr:MATE family efflux transporter [Eubacteriales bacterium]